MTNFTFSINYILFNEYTTFNYIPGAAALETYMPLQFYSAKHASLYEDRKKPYRILHKIFYVIQRGQKKSSTLLMCANHCLDTATGLQIYHLGATLLFPEETCYKEYILRELKSSFCNCINLAVQERFLPFFLTLSCPCSESQESLVCQDKQPTADTSSLSSALGRFIKYLRN